MAPPLPPSADVRLLEAARSAASAYRASLGPRFEPSAVAYAAGRALAMAGHPAAAVDAWLAALDEPTARGWPYLMNALVQAARALGREAEVAAALGARAERLPELHLWQGHLLRLSGDAAAALAPLTRAEALHQGDLRYTATTERVRALDALGRLDEARAVCEAAIAAQPDYALPLQVSLAGLTSKAGDPAAAVALLDAALARAPAFAEAHLNRGGALLRLGDRDAAQAAFAEALRLNPALAPAARQLQEALG
ncbi:MAG: tetratricopeptide repeat protein [Alphaproteobacteria bacterium]|nr:tetratricopeptide repeat protein [Alphaproteobacteria bacterium]